jgi:hypothetical protein
MTNVPCILIVLTANVTGMNRVIEAQGRGPGTFSRRLVAVDTAGPVIAHFAQDMSATDALETSWRAMASDRDLPAISGVWGEDGIISAADAQTAMMGLTVHSIAGDVPLGWTASMLAGHGYSFEPEGEI